MHLHTIGLLHTPFKEKFGIPRQSGLVPQVGATLELLPPYNRVEALEGLESYSHIWIQFLFHQAQSEGWQPRVRPPRLGGNRRVGVFATRSPFRPNPVGLSVVKLDGIDTERNGVVLRVSGVDLLDNTPVIDIKPYVPYVDSIPEASAGIAPEPPEVRFQVRFSEQAAREIGSRQEPEQLTNLIRRLLEIDPRPAYRSGPEPGRVYGIRLYDFDLRWRVEEEWIEVLELARID